MLCYGRFPRELLKSWDSSDCSSVCGVVLWHHYVEIFLQSTERPQWLAARCLCVEWRTAAEGARGGAAGRSGLGYLAVTPGEEVFTLREGGDCPSAPATWAFSTEEMSRSFP